MDRECIVCGREVPASDDWFAMVHDGCYGELERRAVGYGVLQEWAHRMYEYVTDHVAYSREWTPGLYEIMESTPDDVKRLDRKVID